MLVARAFNNNGIVEDCDVVMATSNKYRESQDLIRSFCEERIVEDKKKSVRKMDVHEEFKQWYEDLYGRRGQPKVSDLYDHLNKKLGPYRAKSTSDGEAGWKNHRLLHKHELEQ